MFSKHDLKNAIWTVIVLLLILIPSLSFAQIPQDAERHNRLGNDYCESGDFEKAVKEYEEAIRIYPEYIDAYYNAGVTYYHDLKDYQKAANYFQKFLELESDTPDSKSIQEWLAGIESKHGIKPQPIVIEKKAEPEKQVVAATPPPLKEPPPPLEEALPEEPMKPIVTAPAPPVTTPPQPPIPLPSVPAPQKEPEKPQVKTADSNEEKYNKAVAYKNRGNLYSGEGKHQMAIREYLKAIELRPDYTDALYNIAKTYDFDLNNDEKAIQYYEDFLKYEPQDSRDAREVRTWLTKAKMDLASKKEPPKEIITEPVIQKPTPPTRRAKYETTPILKGLLEKPVMVASMPQKPVVPEIPKAVAPPVPIAPAPTPQKFTPPLAPAGEDAILKSYIPRDLKSVQNSIILRAEMRNELLEIFKSKNASNAESLAQLFLTKIKQEPFNDRFEIAQIEIPGDLLANVEKVYILKHNDRIRLNSEKGDLLRSPQTSQSKKRLQEINKILEDGYEIRP